MAFTAAIEIDAKRAEAYVGRADAYTGRGAQALAAGDYDLAREAYELAMADYQKASELGAEDLDGKLSDAQAGLDEVQEQLDTAQQEEPDEPDESDPSDSSEQPEEPDSNEDRARKEGLLAALDSTEDLLYAKVLDINADGTDDLLTMTRDRSFDMGNSVMPLATFTAYLWNSSAVGTVSLAQHDSFAMDEYAICREKSSGRVVVRYYGYMDIHTYSYVGQYTHECLHHRDDPMGEPDFTEFYDDGTQEITAEEFNARMDGYEVLEEIPFNGSDWAGFWSGYGEKPDSTVLDAAVAEAREQLQS